MTQFHLKPRTTRQPQDTIDGHTRPSTRLVDGHTRLVTIDWRLSCDFHVHLASWNSLGALRLYAWKLQLTVDFQASGLPSHQTMDLSIQPSFGVCSRSTVDS